MSNIAGLAAAQYAFRPKDERYSSLAELITAAQADRSSAKISTIPASQLIAIEHNGTVLAESTRSGTRAALTHWSFGQLASSAGAPASYLRNLPAKLAVDCLNHGIKNAARDNHQILMRNGGPADVPYTIRALTSEQYSRVWDHGVAERVARHQEQNPSWQLPMTWAGTRAGAYRGDRDMFLFLTNGGSIVEDKTIKNFDGRADGTMFRGLIIRNSEVGAAKLETITFLFRVVCGNHIIWGSQNVRQTARRHVGLTAGDAEIMIGKALRECGQDGANDEKTIEQIGAMVYGATTDAVIAQARKDGLTEKDARASYHAAEQHEANPRSVWGFANGITRHSQQQNNQDDRTELDQLAGAILARARKAVYA